MTDTTGETTIPALPDPEHDLTNPSTDQRETDVAAPTASEAVTDPVEIVTTIEVVEQADPALSPRPRRNRRTAPHAQPTAELPDAELALDVTASTTTPAPDRMNEANTMEPMNHPDPDEVTRTQAESDNARSFITTLKEAVQSVSPDDSLAEAGRKILLVEFIKVLKHEEGSRTGEDIEDVHDMRVATRRMRSAFRLLEDHYKSRPIRPFVQQLKETAERLGAVRDLDVMIVDLQKVQAAALPEDQPAVQALIERLDKKRRKARRKLVDHLDSSAYTGFKRAFAVFLTSPGKGAKSVDDSSVTPHRVRHVVPGMLHEHLAAVRAYDDVIETASIPTLHALRIEFKRLRYATSFFEDVLGTSGEEFVDAIKVIQDHLGRLNDIRVFQDVLMRLLDGMLEEDEPVPPALDQYLADLQAEREELNASFPAAWQKFNTRTVQSKLSNALLALR